jgi:aquacobalamin reductase/NAD(P)H-flavin reductase
MNMITCQVESLTSLTAFVYKVLLKPANKVDFIAGQYLNFVMSEEDKRPFSIASAPDSDLIELQIGASGEDSWAMQVIEHIKNNSQVNIEMPLGHAQLRNESTRPILLIAGGTGFSYIKSIFEFLANNKTDRRVVVYWGLRDPAACYELEKTANTISSIDHAQFIPVVDNADDSWQGKQGLVHEVVMQDINSFEPYDIYLAGRFDMVGKIREDFVKRGALLDHMYADAFAFI